ncbi:hypothetical protein Pan110_15730 [Gimesia panareensis]|nr:hypothetical protein Pan110_15730 [Gimesia panareensis]
MNIHIRDEPEQHQVHRAGLTILELLVVMGIISLLAGLVMPAVNTARESARKIQCVNHLRQLGVALHNYHDAYTRLPAGWRRDQEQKTAYGWAATLLPYLEQSQLANLIDFESAVDSVNNLEAREMTLTIFRCPSDVADNRFLLFEEVGGHETSGLKSHTSMIELPSTNYLGVYGISDPDAVPFQSGEGIFMQDRFLRFSECQQGLSNILMVGERTARKLPSTWLGIMLQGEDATGRLVGNAYLGPNRTDADECEFDSRHPGCVNFLWGDGHVKSISDSIDAGTYRRFASRK